MKLELGFVQINDIQFASESKVENGTIYVNAEELKALLLEDENLKLRILFNSLFNGTGLIYLNFIRLYVLSQLADIISSLQACESYSLI